MQAFPGFLLALAIVASLPNAMIAVGIGEAPGYARMVRGSVLSIKNQDYVLAAHVLGASNLRIMRSAVLPNVLAPIVVLATLGFPVAVLAAAALSFVGLGAQPPSPEWGAVIVSGRNFITNAPWMINFPGLAIFLTVLGFNLFGNAIRERAGPAIAPGVNPHSVGIQGRSRTEQGPFWVLLASLKVEYVQKKTTTGRTWCRHSRACGCWRARCRGWQRRQHGRRRGHHRRERRALPEC
jgi:hypothetical protein